MKREMKRQVGRDVEQGMGKSIKLQTELYTIDVAGVTFLNGPSTCDVERSLTASVSLLGSLLQMPLMTVYNKASLSQRVVVSGNSRWSCIFHRIVDYRSCTVHTGRCLGYIFTSVLTILFALNNLLSADAVG